MPHTCWGMPALWAARMEGWASAGHLLSPTRVWRDGREGRRWERPLLSQAGQNPSMA